MSHGTMNAKQPIQHILVAHDFYECSDAALDYAVALARRLGARITVFHAYEIPSMGAPEVLVLATDWTKQFGIVAQEKLDKVVERIRGTGVDVRWELRQGTAWRELDAFAREGQIDLIVVGSHGRRGVPRFMLGSVAEKIVRTAPRPVLVVRGSSEKG
jgi:nucleotide-binding universal stress UspA family protein